MDGHVREIPGYYYDREKKKYFKIQASSAAPASAAYSSFDVKRRKLEDSRSDAEFQRTARQKGRIRVFRALENSTLNGLLAHEPSYSRSNASESVVAGFVHHGFFRPRELIPRDHRPLFMSSPRFDIGQSVVDMRIVTNILSLFRINQRELDTYDDLDNPSDTSRHGFAITRGCDEDQYRVNMTDVTSFSSNRHADMFTRTWLSGRSQEGISIVPGYTGVYYNLEQGYQQSVTTLLGPGLSQAREVAIYSSTSARPGSSLLFAYGTSHGIMTVDKTSFDAKFISPIPTAGSNYPTDIFTLEFLSDNVSVLLSGGRRGILDITDLRVPKFGTDADTITHPSSITHIKQIDSHRILVSGLNSSMRQYDLRFRKLDTPAPPRKSKKLRSLYNASATRSILEYPSFHNTATIQHGLDIEPELGVVAVCQEHDSVHAPVQIFSLHGGHKIRLPALEDVSNIERDQVVRCVQWVDDAQHRTRSLWVGNNGGIDRYAWAGNDDLAES